MVYYLRLSICTLLLMVSAGCGTNQFLHVTASGLSAEQQMTRQDGIPQKFGLIQEPGEDFNGFVRWKNQAKHLNYSLTLRGYEEVHGYKALVGDLAFSNGSTAPVAIYSRGGNKILMAGPGSGIVHERETPNQITNEDIYHSGKFSLLEMGRNESGKVVAKIAPESLEGKPGSLVYWGYGSELLRSINSDGSKPLGKVPYIYAEGTLDKVAGRIQLTTIHGMFVIAAPKVFTTAFAMPSDMPELDYNGKAYWKTQYLSDPIVFTNRNDELVRTSHNRGQASSQSVAAHPTGATQAEPEGDVATRLKELKKIRQQGLISKEDYDRKIDKLIDEL